MGNQPTGRDDGAIVVSIHGSDTAEVAQSVRDFRIMPICTFQVSNQDIVQRRVDDPENPGQRL